MKRVLIIGHLGNRGSPRIRGLAKYLPRCGWQPTILTDSTDAQDYRNGDYDIIAAGGQTGIGGKREHFKFIPDPLLNLAGEFINFPDSESSWRRSVFTRFALHIVSGVGVPYDAIISSSPPVSAHLIGRALAGYPGVPWIADLRDLWSQNHAYHYSQLRQWRDARLEREILATASALVTVTEPWKKKLQLSYSNKPVYAIMNGYDPDDYADVDVPLTKEFTVTYTGTIYKHQDLGMVKEAIRQLESEKAVPAGAIQLRVYQGLPHAEAVKRQCESHINLLLDWNGHNENGVMPLKMFEYLAADRPVLATGGHDCNVVHKLITRTLCGLHAVDLKHVKAALLCYYRGYERGGEYYGSPFSTEEYTHLSMARQFAHVLDSVVGEKENSLVGSKDSR